jgi:zinc finger SWIM domain-containing protein 3
MGHSGHQQASAKFICDVILEQVKIQPRYRPSQIVKDIKTRCKVDITYSKAFRAKELALEHIHDTHVDAYKSMPKYCSDIEKTNPNSVTKLECTSENQFKRVFIAYDACATDLTHCRPLLGLDGTHLKTRYQGILLTAVAVDANGQLFPVAYAIVDAENDDNWLWMLNLLRQVVEKNAPHFLEEKVL